MITNYVTYYTEDRSLVEVCKHYKLKKFLRNFGLFKTQSLYHFDFTKLKIGDTVVTGHLDLQRNPTIYLPDSWTVNYTKFKRQNEIEDFSQWEESRDRSTDNKYKDLEEYCRTVRGFGIEVKSQDDWGHYYTTLTITEDKSYSREIRLKKLLG